MFMWLHPSGRIEKREVKIFVARVVVDVAEPRSARLGYLVNGLRRGILVLGGASLSDDTSFGRPLARIIESSGYIFFTDVRCN